MHADMDIERYNSIVASVNAIPPVASMADIQAIERIPLSARQLPSSTFDMLEQGARIRPDEAALSFFLKVEAFKRPSVWSYDQLLRSVRQAANAFPPPWRRPK